MSATRHSPEVIALADAMLDSKNGVTVSASWGARVNAEQVRRTRMAAAALIDALPKRGLVLSRLATEGEPQRPQFPTATTLTVDEVEVAPVTEGEPPTPSEARDE